MRHALLQRLVTLPPPPFFCHPFVPPFSYTISIVVSKAGLFVSVEGGGVEEGVGRGCPLALSASVGVALFLDSTQGRNVWTVWVSYLYTNGGNVYGFLCPKAFLPSPLRFVNHCCVLALTPCDGF